MKTPLGTKVDLGPCNIVLDGDTALRERGTAAPPLFGPCLLWPRSPISATAELLLHSSRQSVSVLYSGPPFTLKIAPSHRWKLEPHVMHDSFWCIRVQPKQHLDWITRISRLAQLSAECPYTMGHPFAPQNCPFP